jgi:hypothetical protein
MTLEAIIAISGLVVLIAVPFWFATRPVKDPKALLRSDNLTDDRISGHNVGPD